MSEEASYSGTSASMKRILVDALSGNNRNLQNGDNLTQSMTDDDMEKGGGNGQAQVEEFPSSPPQPISRAEATPLFYNSSAFPNLAPQLSPTYAPNTPSPLRAVNSPYSPATSPFTSPIRPLNSFHGTASPSPATHAFDNRPTAYEVDSSFLHAMVHLLERQANIVPEHLFTEADVQRIVQKELQKQDRNTVLLSEDTKRLSSYITFTGTVAMILGGVSFVVFQRACLIAPGHTKWLLEGAWKGAACGMASSMLAKGILASVDKLRLSGNVRRWD